MGLVSILLIIAAVILTVQVIVFAAECFAAFLPETRRTWSESGPQPRTTILVPANNAETDLGPTLDSIKEALTDDMSVLVVADNCTDGTVYVAKAADVPYIERHDAERLGRGYAITFGVEHLDKADNGPKPDVIIVVDPGTQVAPDALKILAQRTAEVGRPVQADYTLRSPEVATPHSVISSLRVLMAGRIRPMGLRKLGLPCHLVGGAVGFPFDVLQQNPTTGAATVDQTFMGVKLAKAGYPATNCAEAQATGRQADEASARERARWANAYLARLLWHGPRLIQHSIQVRSRDLFVLGTDMLIAPLPLFMVVMTTAFFVTLLNGLFGGSYIAFNLVYGSFGWLVLTTAAVWFGFARTIPLQPLVGVPVHFAKQVPVFFATVTERVKSWFPAQPEEEEPTKAEGAEQSKAAAEGDADATTEAKETATVASEGAAEAAPNKAEAASDESKASDDAAAPDAGKEAAKDAAVAQATDATKPEASDEEKKAAPVEVIDPVEKRPNGTGRDLPS